MSPLRVSLLGRFDVRDGRQTLPGFDARKVQELFCYLLLYRDRSHPREALADLLWCDTLTTQSKRYLRKTLWQLQTALDSQLHRLNEPVLLVEPNWIQLNPCADLWLDVAVLEEAFGLAEGVPGSLLESQCVQALKNAVELYQGDLLEGWYQDWCLYERERLQHMYLSMLDKLMGHCEANHECEAGLVYGSIILRYDRARERTHRRMMRLHYLAGDRTAALRQYEHCVTALHEELGVKPARRTVGLHEQICADQLYGLSAPTEEATDVQTLLLPKVLVRLRRLYSALANEQRQVQKDIQAVERALNGQH
jgi:DNA-binding SARP family transcriptional activator